MIKLTKTKIPDILAQNGAAWTKVIVDKIEAGETLKPAEKTRYRHPRIKASLVSETNGKCAYCESKLLHIHHGDVEHIYPKSLDPNKTLDWENLTLACEVCNQNKTNRDPNLEHIIDPYVIEPSEHLGFAGAFVFSKGTLYGTNSRELLELDRGNLIERRVEKLKALISIIETVLRRDLPLVTRQAVYDNFVETDIAPKAEYSAMAASFHEQIKSSLPADMVTR